MLPSAIDAILRANEPGQESLNGHEYENDLILHLARSTREAEEIRTENTANVRVPKQHQLKRHQCDCYGKLEGG